MYMYIKEPYRAKIKNIKNTNKTYEAIITVTNKTRQ